MEIVTISKLGNSVSSTAGLEVARSEASRIKIPIPCNGRCAMPSRLRVRRVMNAAASRSVGTQLAIAVLREVRGKRRKCVLSHTMPPDDVSAYICGQSPNQGTQCGATLQRYYFNIATKVCSTFTYFGCGGNENNFATLSQCNNFCSSAGKYNSGPRLKGAMATSPTIFQPALLARASIWTPTLKSP